VSFFVLNSVVDFFNQFEKYSFSEGIFLQDVNEIDLL